MILEYRCVKVCKKNIKYATKFVKTKANRQNAKHRRSDCKKERWGVRERMCVCVCVCVCVWGRKRERKSIEGALVLIWEPAILRDNLTISIKGLSIPVKQYVREYHEGSIFKSRKRLFYWKLHQIYYLNHLY